MSFHFSLHRFHFGGAQAVGWKNPTNKSLKKGGFRYAAPTLRAVAGSFLTNKKTSGMSLIGDVPDYRQIKQCQRENV